MYQLKTESSFDAAHFLKGHPGKCRNLHGHRWKVEIVLESSEISDGMIIDFADVKHALRDLTEELDHSFIFEKGSLKNTTLTALSDEGFKLNEVPFRPTAENFAKYFFDAMKEKGFPMKSAAVYETPANCALYTE
ncbi:MAG: 6-carboxytetrahydropterin synthase QueD [Lachnospiraceae bacterium]|jgi:6-pyruvoyltetrahydropterin/6-carboxytetrahydropterin synthase|nr:6-carboxytetrahydropterin synthase QueD [Lachnospiraceae bacterium]MEE3462150.1 6-carboxytetrahydropterin synthase QueD [Lachnospiraceae bacterium]